MNRKTRKNRKFRGFNRGRGSGSKSRGAGNRGGRGRAGLGKRAAHNKFKALTNPEVGRTGKDGFNSVYFNKSRTALNVSQLDKLINVFLNNKKALLEKGLYKINLADVGYAKLTGSGKVSKKIEVTVEKVTAGAKSKIEEAGGKVISESESAQEE